MQQDIRYIVRYAGEFGTKDKTTRWKLIHKLENNIKAGISHRWPKSVEEACQIKGSWDKLIINSPVVLKPILSQTPGISQFYHTDFFEYQTKSELLKIGVKYFKPLMKGKRFAVRCKTSGLLPFKSNEIDIGIGDQLYTLGKVDLTNPEVTCFIDAYADHCYLYSNKEKGMGGLPIGSQGKGLCLLSGGFDSSIAAWKMFQAGVDMDFVYFDLGGEAQKSCITNTFFFLRQHWAHGSKGRLFIVDFQKIMLEILNGRPAFQNMILKYAFYQCGEKIAKEEKLSCLISGEAIGQVSTQTLKNLCALDQINSMAMFRPLCSESKYTIMDMARHIGTHDLAYKGPELCAIAGKGVTTGTTYRKLMSCVRALNLECLIDEAVEQRNEYDQYSEKTEVIQASIPENVKIIDLRTKEEFSKKSLDRSENIPFNNAITSFYHWDKNVKYFLVCNVGSQSAILANSMLNEDYDVDHLKAGLQAYWTPLHGG